MSDIVFPSNRTSLQAEKRYEVPHPILYHYRRSVKMKVKVHYLSLVKTFTKSSQDEFNFDESTQLSELLCKVAEKYGKPFTNEVYDPEQKGMKPTFVTMVNGVLMDQLQGINTPLKNGDNVIIMSLMTGG